MKGNLRYYILFLICLSYHAISAQYPLYKSFDIRTENSRPKILRLFLDHNGLIWVGTDKAVFSFDGINFFKIPESDSINSSVSCFFEDKIHRIWVGYENGKIVRIKNQKIIPFEPEEGQPKVAISAISEDSVGRIYFSTKGEGVYCFENNRVYNINHNDGLSDKYCYDMVRLPDQRMCVATDAGLNIVYFKNGNKKVVPFGTSEGLPDDIVRSLEFNKMGELWLGMQEEGIAKYDFEKSKIETRNNYKWSYGQINNLISYESNLLAATEENGIIIINSDGTTKPFQLENNDNIKANDFIIDLENNFWFSESIHLYRTSYDKISLLSGVGQKALDFIHCIISDKNGGMWFSPNQQLGYISKDENGNLKYKEYKILNTHTDIVTLYFDPYGYLWIGTMGKGVFRFNPQTGSLRKIVGTTTAESSSILSINGKGDVVWIGGFNSVMKYEIKKNGNSDDAEIIKTPVFEGSELLNDYVYTVFIDSKGRIWFGTDINGVYSYDGQTLKNIPIDNNAIHSITEDRKGRIWFATADAGLFYLDTDLLVKKFQTKDGLSDPSVTSLLCTYNGNIVIVYSNGFDVLNPETKNIIYHSSEENLADLNCDLNSITASPDSTVWIGTERGIIHYKPGNDMKLEKPEMIIKSVYVYLESIDHLSMHVFDSDQNNFRFDYDGLWYSDPLRTNYSYFLDKFSSKWETTRDHTVSFPKLPPGQYVFRVKVSLTGNFENANEASYAFEITPPVWQRWWFRVSAAGLIALLIFFIIRRREEVVKNIERLKREKIEFQFETLRSQVNPHFLFNSFNTLISVIENTPRNAVEYVERLSEFFRSIVTYRDKNLIKISEEIGLLENYIFIQKKRYGDNLSLDIQIDERTKNEFYIAPLTMQLLTENALKHNAVSKESPLKISIVNKDNKVEITNNINLKIAKEKSAGFGLQNIKSRYALLTDEKFEIVNDGKKFSVIIPLIKKRHEYSDN